MRNLTAQKLFVGFPLGSQAIYWSLDMGCTGLHRQKEKYQKYGIGTFFSVREDDLTSYHGLDLTVIE